MMMFALGAFSVLLVASLVLFFYPLAVTALLYALWEIRRSNLFIWAIFDTYLRQKAWRSGPRLGGLSRQVRRRIERERVKRGLL